MSFLSDIEWQGRLAFEDIVTWFIIPMREYLEMFDEQYVEPKTLLFEQHRMGPAEKRANFFYYEMKDKLNDLEKLLYRLMDDYRNNPAPGKPLEESKAA